MNRSAKIFAQILAASAIFVCAGLNAERNSVDSDDVVKQSTTELNLEDGVSNGYYYGGYDDYCLLYPYSYGCGSYDSGYYGGYGGYGGWGYGGYGGWGGYGRGWGRGWGGRGWGHHGGWGRGGHHGGWGRGGHHGGGGHHGHRR